MTRTPNRQDDSSEAAAGRRLLLRLALTALALPALAACKTTPPDPNRPAWQPQRHGGGPGGN